MTPPSNKQTRKTADATARERAAAIKAQSEREERRRKMMIRTSLGILGVAVVGGLAFMAINSATGGKDSSGLPNIASQGGETLPPWTAPTETANHVEAAGLQVLPTEMLDRHDHVHLDIYVDGKSTPVPAYLGIVGGANATGLSSLHTHDASGVIHIESPKGDRFTLDQIFNEWNVKMSATQIGGLKAGDGKTLTYYVNGKPLTADPAHLELTPHQEIAVVYGTAAENKTVKVPSSYKWTQGL